VQIERLWNRLRDLTERATQSTAPVRLLPIIGPSGCGKSSLARAGLLPELARRPLPGYKEPRVVVMTPGARPLEALAVVLARIATRDPSPVEKAAEFERVLRQRNNEGHWDGLRRIANALPGIDTSSLVILIDQFEEVYSLCKVATDRTVLIDSLIEAAAAPESRVSVILTLRSDFLGETQRHPHFSQIIGSDQSAIIPPMTPGELRRAITKPAQQAGRPLDDATTDLLIEQTKGREGALPLLEFALTRIWEELQNGKLPADTLREIGGVGGALAGEAQRIYSGLSPEEQDIARRVFIGVVELGEGTQDTRRRASVQSLTAPKDDLDCFRQVIDRFAAPGVRLLTLSSYDGNELVEVTHEALFDHWQQLQNWLDNKRDIIRQQRRINAAADEWLQQGKKKGYLLQGKQLDTARDFDRLHSNTFPLSTNTVAFLRESHRLRWINRAWIASLAILPLFTVETYLREDAIRQERERVEEKKEIPAIQALLAGCEKMKGWPIWLYPFGERLFGNCRSPFRSPYSKRDLTNVDFSKIVLSNADLSEANLSKAIFNTNLSGVNFSKAILNRANLFTANLSHAKLDNAELRYADLGNATLDNADLHSAKLNWARLYSAEIRSANLSKAILDNANLYDAKLNKANLSEANLRNANLSEANLSKANLNKANLSEANLSKANLNKANLNKANLYDANLSEANLSEANLRNANFHVGSCAIFKCKLSNAILLATDLREVEAGNEDLDGENSPLLCNTALPKGVNTNPNRDCDRMPQVLLERYPKDFKNLAEAKAFVDKARQKKWD